MIRSNTKILPTFVALFLAAILISCGTAGTGSGSSCGVCGADTDIKGSITSQFGSSAQMKGWVVVFIEKLTGISRVAEVDNAGLYSLRKVKSSVAQTIVLLSPDYIVQSVLSIPPKTQSPAIRQYFKINNSIIPQLIHKGPIIQFQEIVGISITNDLAADADSDSIPDGSPGEAASLVQIGDDMGSLNLIQYVDQDLDGTPNFKDTDIDGDGIANIVDSDDDGDKIRDVFDGDADGDLENDELTTKGDQFFLEGVDYIAVQYQKKPKTTGTGYDITLTFTTRVQDTVSPIAVQIRGAPTLLNNALQQTTNSEDEAAETVWNRLLLDDGLSQDKQAKDRIFGAQVALADGLAPRHHEVLFFQLVFGSASNPWYLEYPFAFPDITPGTVTASYASKTVTLLSLGAKGPFGDIDNFKWAVNLFDSEGVAQWSSEPTDGTTTSIVIPDNQLVSGNTYAYEVVAQVLAKVKGLPAYTIYSSQGSITAD
jgi:hypothetical protein